MTEYHIYGRPFAGSLIAEFLLTAKDCAYTISFPDEAERQTPDFLAKNPTGRIPVLVCPDGHSLFESLAIVHHITERFDGLAPAPASAERDRYLSLITLLATTMYPAYHRQHHTRHYGFEGGFEGIKAKAREMNDTLFDYLESQLSPNLLGGEICAADFYLYMLTRWEPNKDQMRTGRPKLAAFCEAMRQHPVVAAVLAKQPRRK
ncbi:MAG: glutathione S-transferase family protein [Pseudomonadota bacterium]|nr:glutathione S-transferase family protein [Pseudomonadota bacterium]